MAPPAMLRAAAVTMRDAMVRLGLSPPAEHLLIPAVVITSVALLLTTALLLFYLLSPSRSARDAVLILGASPLSTVAPAPGKTSLFHVLRCGRMPPHGTVPTQAPNDAAFAPAGERDAPPCRWVDYPGHARLRPRLGAYLATARAVVFVVDASSQAFARGAREAADLLHDVLADPGVARAAVPMLVFCNKADLPACVTPADVCARLEAEVERVRKAKAAALSGAGNAVVQELGAAEDPEARPVFLGYEDEAFSFEHVANDVRFEKGSAKAGDVSAVVEFVRGVR